LVYKIANQLKEKLTTSRPRSFRMKNRSCSLLRVHSLVKDSEVGSTTERGRSFAVSLPCVETGRITAGGNRTKREVLNEK